MSLIPGEDIISSVITEVGSIIKQVIPDPIKAQEIIAQIQKAQQEGKLEDTKIRISAILAEAQSQDKWTSRARPAFMYVIYIYILMGIPIGILSIFNPTDAKMIAAGVSAWLMAIPQALYQLFEVGYLGYTGFRSFDKHSYNKNVVSKVKK